MFSSLFDKNIKEFFGIMGKRAPSKPVLKKLFGTEDYNTAFERATGIRNLQRRRLGRLLKRTIEDKQFFPIHELPSRLEEQLSRLPGYDGNKRFTFSLRSGITYSTVSPSTKIDNFTHFQSWFNNVVQSESGIDSSNGYRFGTVEARDWAWATLRIENLALLAGGASGDNDRNLTLDLKYYIFEAFSPKNQRNNCGFRCLDFISGGLPKSEHTYRKQYNLAAKTMVPVDVILNIYKELGLSKFLVILVEESKVQLDFEQCNYMLLHNNHYYVVNNAQSKSVAPPAKATKRGWCFWDIETRPTDEYNWVGKTKSHYLKDAILCAYYRNYKSMTWERIIYIFSIGCSRKRGTVNITTASPIMVHASTTTSYLRSSRNKSSCQVK